MPVTMIVGSLPEGLTIADALCEYPQLTEDDVHAALAYAAEALRVDPLIPIQPQRADSRRNGGTRRPGRRYNHR